LYDSKDSINKTLKADMM